MPLLQAKPFTLGNFVVATAKTFGLAVVCFIGLAIAILKLTGGGQNTRDPAKTASTPNRPIQEASSKVNEAETNGSETEITIGSKIVSIGDTADDAFPVLNMYEIGDSISAVDPQGDGGLMVAHTYLVNSHRYVVLFRRTDGEGPYRVMTITESHGD